MESRARASIVVPAHNEGADVFLTLEALRESTEVPHEVIVVDDGSTDGCCDFLDDRPALYPEVRLMRQQRKGVAGARAAGAAVAHTPVTVFLDAHCFPRRDWLEQLVDALAEPSVGIVGPCVAVAGSPSLRGYGMTLNGPDLSVRWHSNLVGGDPEVPVVCGCCMAFRREVFQRLGGFDSMRTYGVEDVEISIRAWLLGYSVRIVPGAEVAHRFKASTNFHVGWGDYLYNVVRFARLHFDGARLQRVLEVLGSKPGYSEAAAEVEVDTRDRRAAFRAERSRDADWLCERFGIPI